MKRVKSRLAARALALVAGALGLLAAASDARAITVERVVAVVGDRPVLLSELRHRAIPSRIRILQTSRDGNLQAAEEKVLYQQLLERMIDDRLEEQAAEKARLNVSPDEIDRGVQNVAASAKLTPADVFREVGRQGLTEQDFRDEIRRQIMEGKLIELRVRPRVRVTESDARTAYRRWTEEAQKERLVEIRTIVLNVTPETLDARAKRMDEIVRAAKAGDDYCKLVANNSEDPATRDSCGTGGPVALGKLPPDVQRALETMRAGDFSPILRMNIAGTERLIFFQRMSEPRLPGYEDVKSEMWQRAMIDQLEHQRKLWLQELRRGVYIDVRL